MALFDECGHPLQLDSYKALAAWNATVRGFLSHCAQTPDHLQAVLDAAPDFALARIAKAFFLMLLGRAETDRAARVIAREVDLRAAQGTLDEREQAYARALQDWLAGCPSAAAARLDDVHARWPGDAMAVKLSHAIRFMIGHRLAMLAQTSKALTAYGPEHPFCGYVTGCHAFALEETGAYAEAERAGRRALDLAADDAWAMHAVTHVHEMTGRSAYGTRFVLENEPAWRHCNNFAYHVWWHLALFYLDAGDFDAALALYDTHIRREKTDDYRDISNAASLLARLELEGVDVGMRWEELAELAEKRIDDACVVFADLHYMLALAGAGRDAAAARLIGRLAADPQNADSEMATIAGQAGHPAALGLQLFKKADYASAYAHLATARPYLQSIGGSHAQRDVFERILIDAAILAGELAQARRLVDQRNRLRAAPDRFAHARLDWIETLGRRSETAA